MRRAYWEYYTLKTLKSYFAVSDVKLSLVIITEFDR